MSLACLECGRIGYFDTLIVFDRSCTFDADARASSFRNFYTCCARLQDFKEAGGESRFMVVQEPERQGRWLTGTDGIRLRDAETRRVDEVELQQRLPRIFETLARNGRPFTE